MSNLIESLTSYVSNTTSTLSPLTLPVPISPIALTPLQNLLDHITTTHVHPTYFPFLRFGAIHASRVTLVWAGMTQNRKPGSQVTLLQDLFGYLVLAWGGGTITSLLLSQPPSWLIDPTPWLIYPPIYLLLIRTGLANYMVQTAPGLINLFGACIDGITRGTTITALPKALASSHLDTAGGPGVWTTALMSGLAVSSGGWVVQGLGLHEAKWTVGKPAILSGSVLDTMDLWSGIVTGLLYAILTRSHASLSAGSDFLTQVLPRDLVLKNDDGTKTLGGLVAPNTARALCVLVLGCLLVARVVVRLLAGSSGRRAVKKPKATREQLIEELTGEKDTAVVKAPVQVGNGSKVTPRKSKKASAKSPAKLPARSPAR